MYRTIVLSLGLLFFGTLSVVRAQDASLSLEAFLGYVKSYHPFVKQAQLRLSESEAKLLKQRGAFDPKLTFDQKQKNFKGTTYYDQQEARIQVPTYYGLSLDAGVQEAAGVFLNPENQVSGDRLYSLGASVELGRGLLSNPRQTALKQAKLFTEQAQEENILEVNQILMAASHAYLDWYKAYRTYQIYDAFVANAAFRFEGVKKRMRAGDLAVIDTTEARIAYNQRRLNREAAQLQWRKKSLLVSNFLWIDDQPATIDLSVRPDVDDDRFITLFTPDTLAIENHPKLRALGYKRDQLVLEKRLQKSSLLPQVSLRYQWLSETDPLVQPPVALDPDNSTKALKMAIPLFLRKERANLKLATLKLEGMDWEQSQTKIALENKIAALYAQQERLQEQVVLSQRMVADYQLLFEGEQKKFEAGESSLFLVNARESKLIEALLKAISLEVAQKKASTSYYYATQFPETVL